jgi:hypothetical protein
MTATTPRSHIRHLAPALLVVASLALTAGRAHAAVTADGYLTHNGPCLILRQHDGDRYALVGDTRGLRPGDHIRLEGRVVPDPGCGAPGLEVAVVQSLWSDDQHRAMRYDRQRDEAFERWAERTGRLGERRAERGQLAERPDRSGRYVYSGPHRRVTLAGRLHEAEGGCASLETEHATFALDGNLGDYQAGDRVKVSGVLYEGDPNAPCGGPTVVITGIRGH